MPLISRVCSLWRNVVHRDRIERDLDDEVRGVVDLLIDEKIHQGMRPEDARRAAMLELGRVDSVKSQVRDARTGASLDVFLQDVRYGARSLRRTPGFTLAAVLTLALGIGANTTIFTLLDAVVFKPLPVPAAHELVTLYENAPEGVPDAAGGTGRYLRFSFPRFERLQQAIGTQGSLAAVTRGNRFIVRLPGSSQVIPVEGQLVSGSYFGTLGVSPARGRLLTAGDARVDSLEPVAVISDGFWKRIAWRSRRRRRPDARRQRGQRDGRRRHATAVCRHVDGRRTRSVAAPDLAAGPRAPDELERVQQRRSKPALGRAGSHRVAERDRPHRAGRSDAGHGAIAGGEPRGPDRRSRRRFDDPQGRREMLAHTLAVESFARGFSGLRGQFSSALLALMAMVSVVLLMTCANIANLMLARAARRSRDVAIRISLGATTGRLIRQGLTESVMLASLGGAAGLLAGEWASGFLAHQVLGSSGQLPPTFAPDARVTAFAAVLSLVTAILFGLAPALRATRAGRTSAIGTTERHAVGQSTMRGMRPLVTAQLALSVVVVFAAALLGRTLINFTRIDPGFERRSSRDCPVRRRLERLFTRPDAGARPAPGRRR